MAEKKGFFNPTLMYAGAFAVLNVIMYFVIHKFWIGGSSFLPMVGKLGPNKTFLFSFIVNMGVIVGALVSSATNREFTLRMPAAKVLPRAILGGFLIGIGVTLAPGTCTTSFVIGLPMLSISSMLSIAGMFAGGFIVYRLTIKS
ncbi:MAG: YeeE/YedE thiosulfate transporter family protein [Candidatus Auribacterota bacterium]